MSRKDPYKILGVGREASEAQIKTAYRRLAKQHHPDRNQGNKNAEQRFKEVQAAYEMLGDRERRQQFDQFGAGGPPPDFSSWNTHFGGAPSGATVTGFGDLNSIFEQFFAQTAQRGGGRRTVTRRRQRGADLEISVDLAFEEAARGAVRQVELRDSDRGGTEKIEFRVPPAVADGQRIRVKGKGQPGAGGRGDLMIRCRIAPHPYFVRNDLDISIELPLSISEASLGAKIDVPTLDGVTTLTVPAGTSSGAKLRLRGKGIHDPRAGRTGDMYAVLRVMVPKSVSPRAAELLRQFDDETAFDPRRDSSWRT